MAVVFPPGEAFETWWAENKGTYLTPESLKGVKDVPLSQFVTSLFLLHTAKRALDLDNADPGTKKKRKNDEPTDGDKAFLNAAQNLFVHLDGSIERFATTTGRLWIRAWQPSRFAWTSA